MNSLPQDFATALKSAGLLAHFNELAPSHQREHLKWIMEAKRPETRKTRIEKAMQMMSQKKKASR